MVLSRAARRLRSARRGPGAGAGSRAAGARLSLCVAAATGGRPGAARGRRRHHSGAAAFLTGRRICGSIRSNCSSGRRRSPFDAAQGDPEHRRGITPRSRINLVLYTGCSASTGAEALDAARRHGNMLWNELMQRSVGFDPLVCACGGRRRLLAVIEAPSVIRRILPHLGLPTEIRPLGEASGGGSGGASAGRQRASHHASSVNRHREAVYTSYRPMIR